NRSFLALVFKNSVGDAVGIIAFYSDHTPFLGFGLKTLRMVGAGSGDSDGLNIITAPGYESDCAKAFIAWFSSQNEWQLCRLETLPEHSLAAESLLRETQESGLGFDSTLTPNFIINLPPTWQQYLDLLDPSFRPLLTRYPKRLLSRFTVKVSRCEMQCDLKAQLDMLFDLHQMRWTGRGEAGAFAGN